jgi:endo-1,4-beta-mannosidase
VTVSINGKVAVTGVCKFTALSAGTPPSAAGYVKVGPNRQHFQLSTGKDYVPVGENLAWVDAAGVQSFKEYLRNISAAGGNYVRLWLTDSWDDLFLETGLGNYSLANAHHLDDVLAAAEAHGVRVLLCIESFNLFCSKKDAPCNWDQSVYNVANGGVVSGAGAFFTDARAMAYFQQRLGYIVARWAHSPSVFAWEFFNEVDITDGYSPSTQAAWVNAMATFLHAADPYGHPVSTSFCCHEVPEVYGLKAVDFAMVHSYGRANRNDMADNAQAAARFQSAAYAKPMLVAETGEFDQAASGEADPTGVGLHNALWAPLFARGAGTAMVWWWDTWVRDYSLYSHFRAVADFVSRVHWSETRWFAVPAAFVGQGQGVRVLCSLGSPLNRCVCVAPLCGCWGVTVCGFSSVGLLFYNPPVFGVRAFRFSLDS